ncbi:hypothetical protein ACJIZ3_008317 [Penstemon smallii]|uniref:Cytochrome P450 n=1 Tax=Penstemon smallii TaxID=265156 RepID=A0ABD3TAE5_9LAMI
MEIGLGSGSALIQSESGPLTALILSIQKKYKKANASRYKFTFHSCTLFIHPKKMDSFFSIAILSFPILLISIFFLLKKSKNLAAPLPPGPLGLPILGYLPYIQKNLHFQFDELAQKYGPIYKLWLGSKLCVVISSPSLMKEIVREHDVIFANHDFTAAGMIATSGGIDIVQSDYGPYWRKMRKLFVREMLSNNNLDASYTLRRDEVRRAIKNVYDYKIGTAINIGELIFLTEINVVLSLIWGGTVDESNRDRTGVEFKEKVSKLIELLDKPNVSDFFPVLERFDFQGIVKELMNGVLPGIEETLDFVINKRKKMILSGQLEEEKSDIGTRKKDFLQILLELKDEDGQPMTHTQIRVFLMVIFLLSSLYYSFLLPVRKRFLRNAPSQMF